MSDTGDGVKSDAMISVFLDKRDATVQDVRDWLTEVERLHIPDTARLDECYLTLIYRSELVESTWGESQLGVAGYDILVGMPR